MLKPEELATYLDPMIVEHITNYINGLPEEGVRLTYFKPECLYEIPDSFHDHYVEVLKRHGAIFTARDGAHWYVYNSKPDARRCAKHRDDMIDAFLADAAPYVRAIRRAIDGQEGGADRKGAERVRKAAWRLIKFTRQQIGRGVQFDSLRRELWLTFSHDVISRAAECDRGFGRDITLEEANRDWPKHPRLARALPLDEGIIGHVEKAGLRGLTIAELRTALQDPSSFRIEERVDALEADGRVQSGCMRVAEGGRMLRRVFAASVGVPHVREDGVGTWGA